MQMADAFIAPQFERSDRPFNASSTARSVATIWRHAVSGRPIQWRKDPTEWNNLAGKPEYARVQAELKEELEAWMKRCNDKGQQTEIDAYKRTRVGKKKKKRKKK